MSESRDAGSRTLSRGLAILRLFDDAHPELTQSEIAEALDLPLPTVHRLCATLVAEGFLARPAGTRRLRLGPQVARMVGPLIEGMGMSEAARAILRRLAEDTGETANLATLVGNEVVYLDSAPGRHLLSPRAEPGLRVPAHCTALGKCLLAQLPDEEVLRLVGKGPYERLTDATHTTWTQLSKALDEVRDDGLSRSLEEYEVGLVSFAVALPAAPDGTLFGISVSLPTSRAGQRREIEQRLRTATAVLRRR
ncbi:IclR family transcriptional regulator [Streptomyces spongiicola]|uniref:IclR family transcriptional regulator n=1 Tax=Streptomyces spongiicola TaxID=1690221 RepID=A0ABM6V6I2_9ACTN|nr:IclR family transcriptional regulator [Streptomyces spongiicola]AWK09640.1 IclR family transcriptional regulator [Streptomyces spongiicola]